MSKVVKQSMNLKYPFFTGLDYDSGQKIYSLQFNLTDAKDRFGNQMTMPGTLLVSVNDLPDKPPLWTSPCFFNTFEEEMPGNLGRLK